MGKAKGPFKEWLKDPEYAKAYNQEGLLLRFWEGLLAYMNDEGITTDALARTMGKTSEELDAYLGGEREITMREAADFCYAAGCKVHFTFADPSES